MKFRIFAATPADYGVFICTSDESHVDVILAGLQLASPAWDFFAFSRLPEKEAIDCKYHHHHEPNPEGQTWHARPEGGPPGERRHQEGNPGPVPLPRPGEKLPQPESAPETLHAGPGGSDAGATA